MVLESTIVCVDNSEFMRNGDFLPTRIQAQQDAVSIICHAKCRQNPENNVALMTSASLEVLVTLTSDVGRILSKLHHVQPSGDCKFLTGIKIAHLALKHRQGRNHKMRIIVFVGSPITDVSDKELVKSAKKLKKEKVNVDVITMGDDAATCEKLTQFVETLNGKEGSGSHLVVVPPGPSLSDALRTSPIVQGDDGYAPPSQDFGAGGFDIDPSLDPELALALRVSMEEQRQRQDEGSTPASGGDGGAVSAGQGGVNTPSTAATTAGPPMDDAMLQDAMAMSLGGQAGGGGMGMDFASMTEDEQIALAIQMSMSAEPESATPTADMETEPTSGTAVEAMDEDGEDYSAVMSDPAFLQHLVGSLPGVDPNSEEIQSAMHALTQGNTQPKDGEDGKKEDEAKK